MLKIGEFSKLSHLTVKALRFYESKGILMPASVDEWTGYRFYEIDQLETAEAVKAYKRLGLTIDEITAVLNGADLRPLLAAKAELLHAERDRIDTCLSEIRSVLEDKKMKYQVTQKQIPEMVVYSCEATLDKYADIMSWIPSVGEECLALNPGLQCADPPYEFCEYLDAEYRENDIRIRHSEAVTKMGNENERIHFRVLPAAKVLCVEHKGPYETITQAYTFLMKYAESNGYVCAGPARECYIDGIWNKESPEEWLTEVQLPIQ